MLISPPLQHRGGDDDLPLSQGRRRILATSWPPLQGKARDKRSRAAGCSKTPRLSRLGDGGQRHSPFSGARPIQKKGAPSPLTMRRACMRASWPSETVQVPPTPAAHTALKAGTLSTWGMGACSIAAIASLSPGLALFCGRSGLCVVRATPPEEIARPDWGHGPWLWDVQLPLVSAYTQLYWWWWAVPRTMQPPGLPQKIAGLPGVERGAQAWEVCMLPLH